MVGFIDDQRGKHGVEPICRVLQIAPSTYYDHLAKRADPARLTARARRDAALRSEIQRVFEKNWRVYGVRKVWRQLERFYSRPLRGCQADEGDGYSGDYPRQAAQNEGTGQIGSMPVGQGKSAVPCARAGHAPGSSIVAPLVRAQWTTISLMSPPGGFASVAFVIDAYARRIVGWRISASAQAGLVLDALGQAVHDRRPVKGTRLVHHSDRGSQYLSIEYTERQGEAGIEPSGGSVGDSHDNALARRSPACPRQRVIHRRGPWGSFKAVEYASNGSTGSTTAVCLSRSEAFLRRKLRQTSTRA